MLEKITTDRMFVNIARREVTIDELTKLIVDMTVKTQAVCLLIGAAIGFIVGFVLAVSAFLFVDL